MDQFTKKILTLSPYGSLAPTTGGTKRIHYLNRGYASAGWDVTQISGASVRKGVLGLFSSQSHQIAPGYSEDVYFNPLVIVGNRLLRMMSTAQIAASALPAALTPHPKMTRELSRHKVVLFEHPQFFELAEPHLRDDHLVILDAHNIESRLYADVQNDTGPAAWAARKLFDLEQRCMSRADLVFTCSEPDREIAISEFGVHPDRAIVASNGVDIATTPFVSAGKRAAAKLKLGVGSAAALFVGSNWPPNVEAAKLIVEMAKKCEDIIFLIVGSVGDELSHDRPDNLVVTGMVDNLQDWFAAADLAVNPMVSGSGSNIKMFEYCAAGLPTISSPFGARGIEDPDEQAVVICEIDEIPERITALLSENGLDDRRAAARKLAENNYDWAAIATQIIDRIEAELRAAR